MIRPRFAPFLVFLFPFTSPGLAQNPEPRPLVDDPVVIEADDFGVEDFEAEERAARERRLELITEQLSLRGFRALLIDRIIAELQFLESERQEVREAEARRAEERRAIADAEAVLEQNPVLRRLVEERESAQLYYGPDPVELAVTSAALGRLLERLRELDAVAAQSREADERILNADLSEDIASLQTRARVLRRQVESALLDLAEDVLDSGIQLEILISALTDDGLSAEILEQDGQSVPGPAIEPVVVVAEPGAGGGSTDLQIDTYGVDPFALLPELFPWPPPRASASAVIRNAFFSERLGAEPTLGEVSDLLVGAMSEAGYHELSYLGAPGGFALVTRIEQTRADGTPLEETARWAARIERVKSFSLSDILQAIFTAPEGYYRVIALIVTDTPFSQRGGEALLSTVETWISAGVNVLPVAIEALPFTPAHDVTALVYEFRKRTDGEAPSVNLSNPLPAPRHLAHTRLAGGFR